MLGSAILPVISQIYSLGLLVEASEHWNSLAKRSKRTFVVTIVLNAVVILGYGVLYGIMLGPLR